MVDALTLSRAENPTFSTESVESQQQGQTDSQHALGASEESDVHD